MNRILLGALVMGVILSKGSFAQDGLDSPLCEVVEYSDGWTPVKVADDDEIAIDRGWCVTDAKEKPCLCNLTGKNICGFVFGDVYPDKCRWFTLPQPFYFFDKAELSYGHHGVLREIMFSKDLTARYTRESVIREVRSLKVALEKHFGFAMEEKQRKGGTADAPVDESDVFECSTAPRMHFSEELCEAWIRVRYETRGKRGKKLDAPHYSILLNIEDKSKVEDFAKRPVHQAAVKKPKPEIGVEKLLPSPSADTKIARELAQKDLDACVAAMPKYTWSDIEASKVTGVRACKAAVELQKRDSHMYHLSLRDKELAQEAAVELSDRLDALEREVRALKEMVK